MKIRCFSVFDSKANAYLMPFFYPETAMAIRAFSDMVNSDETPFGKHPGDYTLFEYGVWDDSKCHVECYTSALSVGNGLEYVEGFVHSPVKEIRNETA